MINIAKSADIGSAFIKTQVKLNKCFLFKTFSHKQRQHKLLTQTEQGYDREDTEINKITF